MRRSMHALLLARTLLLGAWFADNMNEKKLPETERTLADREEREGAFDDVMKDRVKRTEKSEAIAMKLTRSTLAEGRQCMRYEPCIISICGTEK